jgi:Resolvase, N terminal domain
VFAAGDKGTDWKDLAQSQGRERARIQLQVAFRSAERRSLTEAIDTKRPAASWCSTSSPHAEFERGVIRERTKAGLEAARTRGKLGERPPALKAADLVAR